MNLRPARRAALPLACALSLFGSARAQSTEIPLPDNLRTHLVCAFDFEHPAPDDPAIELDQGVSGTSLHLVNGGAAMRVADGARPGSLHSLQTRQISSDTAARDDWKAGCFDAAGVPTLARFRSARGITLMGWVKSTAPALRPALDTSTPAPDDRFNAIGLFGLLHGRSDGHQVRALVELIRVEGRLSLIALGRRLDDGPGLFVAATEAPDALLPPDTWVHLAATFDYETGTVALYRNGLPLVTQPPSPAGDPWKLTDTALPPGASPSTPAGIKIGGSFPQNTRERNPFDGRFDDLLFFDCALSAAEIRAALAP